MSDVSPIGRPGPAALSRSNHQRPSAPRTGPQTTGRDQVELSRTAQLLSKINELPDVRQGLVDRVRAEIESGNYETPEKLDAAVDRLIEEEGA